MQFNFIYLIQHNTHVVGMWSNNLLIFDLMNIRTNVGTVNGEKNIIAQTTISKRAIKKV